MKEYIVLLDEEEAFYGYNDNAWELIRCKDCKNWETDEDERCMYCGEGVLPKTEACMGFGYCSMAERKETT